MSTFANSEDQDEMQHNAGSIHCRVYSRQGHLGIPPTFERYPLILSRMGDIFI